MSKKTVCNKHLTAYEISLGCPYCPVATSPKSAVNAKVSRIGPQVPDKIGPQQHVVPTTVNNFILVTVTDRKDVFLKDIDTDEAYVWRAPGWHRLDSHQAKNPESVFIDLYWNEFHDPKLPLLVDHTTVNTPWVHSAPFNYHEWAQSNNYGYYDGYINHNGKVYRHPIANKMVAQNKVYSGSYSQSSINALFVCCTNLIEALKTYC
jgi:hypothetical protein